MERIDLALASGAVHRALVAGPADGELVLLLHGFPQTSAEWRFVIPALAEAGYRVVAPDQRGYTPGARPIDVAEYECDRLVADVAAFGDALGVDRFHLVGHDWGGFVAWWAGGRLASRLHTLTAVSTPHPLAFHDAYNDTSTDQRERSVYMDWFRSPEAEAMLLADDGAMLRSALAVAGEEAAAENARFFTSDVGALTGALNWYRANDFTADTGPVTTPMLYVWSDADISLGPDAAARSETYVQAPYRFEVLEGVTHWIPDEAPGALIPLLLEHLATTKEPR